MKNFARTRCYCPQCKKRQGHTVAEGKRTGKGKNLSIERFHTCDVCKRVERREIYPNLLSDFFSIPLKNKG